MPRQVTTKDMTIDRYVMLFKEAGMNPDDHDLTEDLVICTNSHGGPMMFDPDPERPFILVFTSGEMVDDFQAKWPEIEAAWNDRIISRSA